MRWLTHPALRLFLVRIRSIVVVGAVFGAAVGAGVLSPRLLGAGLGAVSGAIDFATMGLLIGGAETFLPRTRLGKMLDRSPFLVTFAIKSIAYGAVILCVVAGRLGPSIAMVFAGSDLAQQLRQKLDAKLPAGILVPVAFLVVPFFILLHQLRQLIGERTLRDIVWGRYHRPRTEERFFLFVDITGSTPLAERLGPESIHRFLNRVFQIASNPIDLHAGEVYQYVGDEMVITWRVPEGRASARPISGYFAIQRAIAESAANFEREFGAVPGLRAALHAGSVITGEVGGSRRAIVFHGDVMNTTSRIENATRDLSRASVLRDVAAPALDSPLHPHTAP